MANPVADSTADSTMPPRHRVLLGVAGGIAAYKAAYLLRLLREAGHDVRVLATPSALQFVGAPTWEALSGHPVSSDVFTRVHEVEHVALGRSADLVVVAPATADLLARAANGRADDILTATLLTATCPVVMAPAMHTEMWRHPATVANVETLRSRGVVVLNPASGRLTGADSGEGRLPEPDEIHVALTGFLPAHARDLVGRRVVVTAGGTREPLDPVRYLANRSSGRQGFAIAAAAAARGAQVRVVAANPIAPAPAGVAVQTVQTTAELAAATLAAAADADMVVMAAAPADFTPAHVAGAKIKKPVSAAVTGDGEPDRGGLTLRLVQTTDVLAELGRRRRPGQVLVGFAAETGDENGAPLDHARRKLAAKGADLLVLNEVGGGKGFGTPNNAAVILAADGSQLQVPDGLKVALGHALLDAASRLLDGPPRSAGADVSS